MDWGLAKVLKEGGVADEAPGGPAPEESADRDGAERFGRGRVAGRQRAGHAGVHGARAGRRRARADRSPGRRLRPGLDPLRDPHRPAGLHRAATPARSSARRCAGDTADALARLDGCGAEAELIALARDCLAVEPEDRPRDAGSWPSGSRPTWRACRSGCRRPSASVPWPRRKAVEERRRRKVQLALAASVLALTTLGGLSTTYYLQQRQARAAAVDRDRRSGRPRSATRPWRIPRTSRAGRWRWPPSSRPTPPAIPRRRPSSWPCNEDPGRAGRGPARQGAARSPGRHPLGRGRRPGRLGHRRAPTPTPSARPGSIWRSLPPAEAGAKIKARPPSVALAWPGRWTTGRRFAGGSGQRRRGGATERGRPGRRPRPLAQRAPHRPGSSRQGGPADRAAGPGKGRRSSTSWGRSACTCWGPAWTMPATAAGRVGAADGPAAPSARCLGQLRPGPGCWRRSRAATRRSASTPPRVDPPRDGPRAGPCPGEAGRVGRGDRRVPGSRPAAARKRPAPGAASARRSRARGGRRKPADALEAAVAARREAIRLKPDDARRPHQPRHRPGGPGQARRGHRRIPRGDPAQARLRRGPLQPRQRPGGPGQARRGHRRIPRGDPAQARRRRAHYNLGIAL